MTFCINLRNSFHHPTDIYFFPIDIFKSIGDDLSSVYAVDNPVSHPLPRILKHFAGKYGNMKERSKIRSGPHLTEFPVLPFPQPNRHRRKVSAEQILIHRHDIGDTGNPSETGDISRFQSLQLRIGEINFEDMLPLLFIEKRKNILHIHFRL